MDDMLEKDRSEAIAEEWEEHDEQAIAEEWVEHDEQADNDCPYCGGSLARNGCCYTCDRPR